LVEIYSTHKTMTHVWDQVICLYQLISTKVPQLN